MCDDKDADVNQKLKLTVRTTDIKSQCKYGVVKSGMQRTSGVIYFGEWSWVSCNLACRDACDDFIHSPTPRDSKNKKNASPIEHKI